MDIKSQMTAADWDHRFEQLFDLYLIDVDDDYFNEEMPFKDPSQLEDKFETLQTQNLMYVMRLQDLEAQLDFMTETERSSRAERDKEYYKQLEYKNQIEGEIEKSAK